MADKLGTITFRYFIKGDYVRTPDGVGIVFKDEEAIHNANELIFSQVAIQHKYGNSNNTNNSPIPLDREYCHITTKEEYDSEKE